MPHDNNTINNASHIHYQQTANAAIETANSLPFSVYRDKEVFINECNALFLNEWVFACAKSQIPEPGNYFAFTLVREPIVIIHGQDQQIRVFANTCRHRGTPLIDEGFGTIDKHITCPYHAWTYSDTGNLKAAPHTGEIHISHEQHKLIQYHVEEWQNLLFIHLGSHPQPLRERLDGLKYYLSHHDLTLFKTGHHQKDKIWQCNWKLAVENGIESYHLFKVHKETLEQVTPIKDAFYVAGSSEWSVTAGRIRNTSNKLMKWLSGNYAEAYDHYQLIFLPPSFIGILNYGSLEWINILPESATSCRIQSGGISEDIDTNISSNTSQFAEAFLQEDKVICERLQRGMQSQRSYGGKLVEMEQILVDFRQFLASRLFDTAPLAFKQTDKAEIFINREKTNKE